MIMLHDTQPKNTTVITRNWFGISAEPAHISAPTDFQLIYTNLNLNDFDELALLHIHLSSKQVEVQKQSSMKEISKIL